MTYYADTSWWLNYLLPEDVHHPAAIRLFERDPDARVLWTPWQRVEVFNGIYQLERAGSLPPGDGRRISSLAPRPATEAVARQFQLASAETPA